MKYSYAEYVPMLKALSDETRLKIVDMLSGGEMCACKILEAFSITQPTLSYHMKILTGCGIVSAKRDGAWMHYHLSEDKTESLLCFLSKLTEQKEQADTGGCSCGAQKGKDGQK